MRLPFWNMKIKIIKMHPNRKKRQDRIICPKYWNVITNKTKHSSVMHVKRRIVTSRIVINEYYCLCLADNLLASYLE